MMKIVQEIEYEIPAKKVAVQPSPTRGRKRGYFSPMNQSAELEPQFDLERSCGGHTGKTESGGSVPRSNKGILDDMEDDEFGVPIKHEINDELKADLAGAK